MLPSLSTWGRGLLNYIPLHSHGNEFGFSEHTPAGWGGRQPRSLLAREGRRGEGREPGQDENSVFSQQSKDGVLSAPHRLLTLCTKPALLLREKLLASAYRLRGAVSTQASPPLRTTSFRVQTLS